MYLLFLGPGIGSLHGFANVVPGGGPLALKLPSW
jgi:hypothetical protein